MNLQDARRIFADTRDDDEFIPFDFPIDCCMARAAEMRRRLRENGFDCKKAYLQAHVTKELDKKSRLKPTKPNVEWTYHIAPLVYGEDGREYVIDPSLASDVISRGKWVALMPDTEYPHPQVNAVIDGSIWAPLNFRKADKYKDQDWVKENSPVLNQIRRRFTEHWATYFGGKVEW